MIGIFVYVKCLCYYDILLKTIINKYLKVIVRIIYFIENDNFYIKWEIIINKIFLTIKSFSKKIFDFIIDGFSNSNILLKYTGCKRHLFINSFSDLCIALKMLICHDRKNSLIMEMCHHLKKNFITNNLVMIIYSHFVMEYWWYLNYLRWTKYTW